MADFLFLLHETPNDFSGFSPEQLQAVIEEYVAWTAKLTEQGRIKAGHKLKDEGGRWVTKADGKFKAIDGPYTETKEVVGGLYVIEAKDYADAVKLSEDHPHLKFGGRIEIREIDDLGSE